MHKVLYGRLTIGQVSSIGREGYSSPGKTACKNKSSRAPPCITGPRQMRSDLQKRKWNSMLVVIRIRAISGLSSHPAGKKPSCCAPDLIPRSELGVTCKYPASHLRPNCMF